MIGDNIDNLLTFSLLSVKLFQINRNTYFKMSTREDTAPVISKWRQFWQGMSGAFGGKSQILV